jgi:hypothetical protein
MTLNVDIKIIQELYFVSINLILALESRCDITLLLGEFPDFQPPFLIYKSSIISTMIIHWGTGSACPRYVRRSGCVILINFGIE